MYIHRMEADDIVKVIQACTAALILVLGALGFGHHAKKKARSNVRLPELSPPASPSPHVP